MYPAVALLTSQETISTVSLHYDFLVVNGKGNVRKYAFFSVRDTLLHCVVYVNCEACESLHR